jgi:cytochrome c peroxidase
MRYLIVAVAALFGISMVLAADHSTPVGIDPAFDPVVEALLDWYRRLPQYAPMAIRLAFHASASFNASSGEHGSNGGALQYPSVYNANQNKGLDLVVTRLEAIHAEFHGLTRADLYILSGVVAIPFLGGPPIEFCGGREDWDESRAPPQDLMPEPNSPHDDTPALQLQHVYNDAVQTFERMGFNEREMVTLLGAHSVGIMRNKNSGYNGPWFGEGDAEFSNRFYKILLELEWSVYTTAAGNFQFANKEGCPPANLDGSTPLPTVTVFNMLPSDMALVTQNVSHEIVLEYAYDNDAFRADFTATFQKLITAGVTCKPVVITPAPTGLD